MNLLPTVIARLVEFERLDEAKEYGMVDCFECGCCTYICPAKRKLLELIKYGKARLLKLHIQEQARKKAEEEKSKVTTPA